MLSPFIYTQLIWVVILGYLVFDHVPTQWTMAGAAMVIAKFLFFIFLVLFVLFIALGVTVFRRVT